MKTTSINILDNMDNTVKEKLHTYRDDSKNALLVKLCEKSIGIFINCNFYNAVGNWQAVAQAQYRVFYGKCKAKRQILINGVHDWSANGSIKHKTLCQNACQSELDKQVYLDQQDARRAGLNYKGHNHKRATKQLYTMNNLLEYPMENATMFSLQAARVSQVRQEKRRKPLWKKRHRWFNVNYYKGQQMQNRGGRRQEARSQVVLQERMR